MAINGLSSATQSPHQVSPQRFNPQQLKLSRDSDGDTDGTKAGQVDKASVAGRVSGLSKDPTSAVGSLISEKV